MVESHDIKRWVIFKACERTHYKSTFLRMSTSRPLPRHGFALHPKGVLPYETQENCDSDAQSWDIATTSWPSYTGSLTKQELLSWDPERAIDRNPGPESYDLNIQLAIHSSQRCISCSRESNSESASAQPSRNQIQIYFITTDHLLEISTPSSNNNLVLLQASHLSLE